MQGLVQKSGYIKPGGGAGNYTEYIGTRDGVELLNAGDQYLKYIAERPRSHGLFSNAESTNLDDTMKEVDSLLLSILTSEVSTRCWCRSLHISPPGPAENTAAVGAELKQIPDLTPGGEK